jgi:predicted phage terminase large subunit-like protein
MIDRSWFEIVDSFPVGAKRVRYWDMAATEKTKENEEPCWTVGVRMSRTSEGLIFVEHVEDLQGAPGTVEKVVRQRADLDNSEVGRHPIRMEEEPGSSGKNNTNNYQRNVLPMYDFKGDRPTGAKDVRIVPFANQVEAGNVYLVRGSWNARYLEALEALPDAGWDYGDASSGAYNFLAGLGKVAGRIRVAESRGSSSATRRVQEGQEPPEPDMVPVYHDGRCIGYEQPHTEAQAKVLNLLPVYEEGKLVRYDRTARPYGHKRKGLS